MAIIYIVHTLNASNILEVQVSDKFNAVSIYTHVIHIHTVHARNYVHGHTWACMYVFMGVCMSMTLIV